MNPTAIAGVFLAKFWILDPLYSALGTLMAWFYDVIPSFGGAIILLTLAVRLLTFPLTAKQARSQQELQRHQPEIKRLQAKYKGDKQKLNEEMMKFYKENHVNPFGGCLPLVVQFPVLIVLYRLILDLTHKPPKHIPTTSSMYAALRESGGKMVSWGMDLSQRASRVSGGKRWPFLLLVLAVMATGYYQQRQLTARLPKESANSQMAVMGKVMPVFFGFISWSIPAGVVVYFLVSNIWQIGQQGLMFRNQPKPEVTPKDAGTAKKGSKPPAKPPAKPKGRPQKGKSVGKGVSTTPGAHAKRGTKTPKPDRSQPVKGTRKGSAGTGDPSQGAKKPERGRGAPTVRGKNGGAETVGTEKDRSAKKDGRNDAPGSAGAVPGTNGSSGGDGSSGSPPDHPASKDPTPTVSDRRNAARETDDK